MYLNVPSRQRVYCWVHKEAQKHNYMANWSSQFSMCKNVQRKWKCKANVFFHYKKKVISIGDICLDEWTHMDHVYIISHIIWQNIFLALYLFLGECLCSQGSYDASLMSSQMWYIKEAFLKCYMSSAMFLHRSNAQWVFPLVPFELQT